VTTEDGTPSHPKRQVHYIIKIVMTWGATVPDRLRANKLRPNHGEGTC